MKFFHLSDLHIGLKLINRDLMEDQKYILNEIVRYGVQEQPDAVVIAGDVYDKAIPSAEAVELFDWFITELMCALPDAVVMVISGNHDSAPRLNCLRSLLSRQHLYMIGLPPRTPQEHIERVTMQDEFGTVDFYLLPFVKPSMAKMVVGTQEDGTLLSYSDTIERLIARESIDTTKRNVLVSHQFYLPKGKSADEIERMGSELCVVGNIDEVSAQVLEPFDYAALGHIHKPMKVGSEYYRYCGTLLACSVSEAQQQKGIILVELSEKGNVKTSVLPLSPLREVRILKGLLEEVLAQACDDYVTVILTDPTDLDVFEMQERLRTAFPNLLEVRREFQRQLDYTIEQDEEMTLDPFALCCSFLKEMTEEEQKILRDIIHDVQEVK